MRHTVSVLASLLIAAPAVASTPAQLSQVIRTEDLDLTRIADQVVLDQRIRRTANAVCRVLNADVEAVRTCVARSVRAARSQRDALLARRSGLEVRAAYR